MPCCPTATIGIPTSHRLVHCYRVFKENVNTLAYVVVALRDQGLQSPTTSVCLCQRVPAQTLPPLAVLPLLVEHAENVL